ncbi:putative rhomboid family membrane protein [Ceratocystis lukuohia]|uniref:Rhomboid-type serine protease n=1 Tax=Ceratocystis lukuohia TaxID=2019550 RepID=A0ABR4MC87_9PEZI
MASNDYYYGSNAGYHDTNQQSQQSYPQPYVTASKPAPPYYAQGQGTPPVQPPSVSNTPAPPAYPPSSASRSNTGTPRPGQPPHGQSPFETVFDDHVYPDPDSTPAVHHAAASHNPNPNVAANTSYYNQDTAYHGGTQPYNQSSSSPSNDIPLENRNHSQNKVHDPEDFQDHVYDAPKKKRSRKKGKVSFGQLGMMGANTNRFPFLVYTFSIIQIGVFIGELIRNGVLTGSPIMTKPSFNPMIGPSTWVLINMGGRYTPCMHNIPKIQGHEGSISWPCPNTTTTTGYCSLSQLCGMGGVPEPLYDGNQNQSPEPNQWWRFITPVFMHAGIIHIGFNLMMQLTIGKEMECAIGSFRFFIVYMSGGIFGNVLGANYAGDGLLSTGASGALFSCIALVLLDLLYSWGDRRNPVKDLAFIMLDIGVSFVLGLLPGLDNFAHIGGFLMGLGLGIALLHSPNALRRRLGLETPYTAVSSGVNDKQPSFLSNPTGFFKGRRPLWWGWWLLRAGSLIAMIVAFVVLLNNFYKYHNECSWCKYMSCLPVRDWCQTGDLDITDT